MPRKRGLNGNGTIDQSGKDHDLRASHSTALLDRNIPVWRCLIGEFVVRRRTVRSARPQIELSRSR
jgi:hypothetical protein